MNNKAFSALLGVIILVAITIAIASVVYVYVNNMRIDAPEQLEQPEYISGNLTNIQYSSENKYLITLDNDSYIVGFAEISYDFYSFTIGDYYTIRLSPENIATLVIEVNTGGK